MSEAYYTQDQIQSELNYQRAQKLSKLLLDSGMISPEEYQTLSDINLKTFSPLFAEIYPDKA